MKKCCYVTLQKAWTSNIFNYVLQFISIHIHSCSYYYVLFIFHYFTLTDKTLVLYAVPQPLCRGDVNFTWIAVNHVNSAAVKQIVVERMK